MMKYKHLWSSSALKTVEIIVDLRKDQPISTRSVCQVLLLPRPHHLPGAQEGAKHQLPHPEGSAEAALEEVSPPGENDVELPHCHHQLHPHVSITVWFAAVRVKAKPQCIIHSTEEVVSCILPFLQELHTSRTRRQRAARIQLHTNCSSLSHLVHQNQDLMTPEKFLPC